MSEIIVKESTDKTTIIINHFAGLFRPQIEKDNKTNEIRAKWPYMFFIPIKRIVNETLEEVIGVPIIHKAFGKEYARDENRFHIILKFPSKMLMIGTVNFIYLAYLDFSISQRMDWRHKYQNSVTKEDIFKIAKVLGVKGSIVTQQPKLGPA
ncbi:MAG: hypothetical protein KKD18_00510 [Nanoarchaeota archaeon]|nr:hypothetical protein [Nanoarchaeota archaeon]MBU0976881.1 hypothetical protein [Nanoarchaeota archaeon]